MSQRLKLRKTNISWSHSLEAPSWKFSDVTMYCGEIAETRKVKRTTVEEKTWDTIKSEIKGVSDLIWEWEKTAIVYLKMGKGHKHRRKKEEDKIT